MTTFTVSGSKMIGFPKHKPNNETSRLFREHSIVVEAVDATAAVAEFRKRFGFIPDYVNFKDIVGVCEACARVIFLDDRHAMDSEDGISLCGACCDSMGVAA